MPFSLDLTITQWFLAILSAMVIGVSKTGISGAGIIAVPLLAGIFGGRPSTGLLLPILITADLFAVKIYHSHVEWKYILRLLPWAFTGILAGVVTGGIVNDNQFRKIIAVVVISGILLMIYRDFRKVNLEIPKSWWFSGILGLGAGFSTMIGNAAGPVMAYYLLSMRLPKNSYIATGAWFFLIINLVKIPFHVFAWKTITTESLYFDFLMILPVIAGALSGYYLVKLIPEKAYRIFIIITTLAAAIVLF